MRLEYLMLPVAMAWIGTLLGVVPIYVGIGVFVLSGLVIAREAANLFRGDFDGSVANATTGISLSNFEQTPVKQNWNCKNCGGPNIDQVKCQYCGMVKE